MGWPRMKMKQISAASVAEALNLARRELGEDAVLLETKKSPKGKGVVVTFAIDAPDEMLFAEDAFNDNIAPFASAIPKPAVSRAEIDHPAFALMEESLRYHAVPENLAARIRANLRKVRLKPDALVEVAQTALADALEATCVFQPILANHIPHQALMLVGPHGAGKTSTIAKFASRSVLANIPVVLISTDTEQLGGADGLQKLSGILKCDFYVAENRAALKILLKKYLGKALVLVDSAGANIYEFAAMKALGEFAGLADVEPILTVPAGMDADEAQEMASVFSFLNIARVIVTRADATRRLKAVFAALATGNYALANVTASASPGEAAPSLTPTELARLMLRHTRERMT